MVETEVLCRGESLRTNDSDNFKISSESIVVREGI